MVFRLCCDSVCVYFAVLSPQKAGLNPRLVHVVFMVEKVTHGNRVFSVYFGPSLSVSFHPCSVLFIYYRCYIIIIIYSIVR